jgi:iron complex transport system substrate-binding protein
MKRSSGIFVLLIAAVLLISACAPVAAPSPTAIPTQAGLTLTDGLGRTVTMPKPALKIVSMAPSNTEILFALNAGPAVIGRDEFSDYPSDAKNIASIGGSMGKYNFEEIAKLQPDLVLASSLNTPEQIKALEDLKLTVFEITNPTTIDGLYANLETVGKLTGHTADAGQLVDSLKQRVSAVIANAAKATSQLKVFYELDGTDPSKPWTAGPGSYVDTLIKMAGGLNAAASLKGDYAQISQEELIATNPDIILLGDGAYGVTPDQVAQRPGWSVMAAVQNKKVLTFDDNTVSRPGPRLVDGLEMLYKVMHP